MSLLRRSLFALANRQQQGTTNVHVKVTDFADRHETSKHTITTMSKSPIGIAFDLKDQPGSLSKALSIFEKYSLNLTHISNRAAPIKPHNQMFIVYFNGDWNKTTEKGRATERVIEELKEKNSLTGVYRVGSPLVPWFPREMSDLDLFSRSTLDAGDELQSDHPGFSDPEYRLRREEIAKIAKEYKKSEGSDIPTIKYTFEEIQTWHTVWNKMTSLFPKLACAEYNNALKELIDAGIYGPEQIPQLQDLSNFMKSKTGFTMRPVTGLLSGRDFLNALAFRVFFSTQYMRHHSVPFYTPEPDVIHELLGHAPMFLNKDFADFTQYIGLASLGATDEEIKRLATCYWFSVEFGVLFESGDIKAYGAGVLSSVGELENATSPTNPNRKIKNWNPFEACHMEYPITTLQPNYFAAKSLEDAKKKMKEYCDSIKKPFNCIYDEESERVYTDIDVFTRPVGMEFDVETESGLTKL